MPVDLTMLHNNRCGARQTVRACFSKLEPHSSCVCAGAHSDQPQLLAAGEDPGIERVRTSLPGQIGPSPRH